MTTLAGVVLAHLVAISGCYDPAVRDCTVSCATPDDCTGGQTCRDGWCMMPGAIACPAADQQQQDEDPVTPADAALSTPDATSTSSCELGCTNGTCVAGVCVIDCSLLNACPNDVMCPPKLPCRVICGEEACKKKVVCGMATSCEVQCGGTNACADDILCNTGRCTVSCSGVNSCTHRTRCMSACACDVRCTGPGACAVASECPATTCRLGNGCSSLLAGCDDC